MPELTIEELDVKYKTVELEREIAENKHLLSMQPAWLLSEQQEIVRRNIEVLISVRKSVGNNPQNSDLLTQTDNCLKTFIAELKAI